MSAETGKINGSTAAAFGCIATFESADGLIVTRHASGPPVRALRRLCDHVVSMDASYRLVAYSTPQTILSTMLGRKNPHGKTSDRTRMPSIEKAVLARAGRVQLLHPRLGA